MRMEGKVAMVSGAGHGIGEAIATRFAEEGAKVLVCDLDESRAQSVASAIVRAEGEAAGHAMDVRERLAVEGAVAAAVEHRCLSR